jgi:hypothetical protein
MQLDKFRMYALLVQQRARHAPEPVRGHLVTGVPKSAQSDCRDKESPTYESGRGLVATWPESVPSS